MIEVKNLHKNFEDLEVLKGITTTIHPSDVVCVIGPSGSGKSTFLRCLNLLEKPTSGQIIFAGNDLTDKKTNLNLHRQKMGMVFQQFHLFPHMTVLDNLTAAPVMVKKIPKEEAVAKAMELLKRVGLDDRADAYPDQLSGGQKQRVAIVRALAMNPEVLLFDEPTSALDPEMVGEVQNLMKDLAADGMTMIVVSHDVGFACELADRIIFLDHGHVVENDTPAELRVSANERIREFLSVRHIT